MKKLVGILLVGMFVVPTLTWATENNKETVELKNSLEKLGYSIGLDAGTYFKKISGDIDYNTLLKGIDDGFKGNDSILSTEEITAVKTQFGLKMKALQEERLQTMKEENQKAGAAFLEQNKKNEGVVVTNSGLQYQLVQKGEGAKPKATDRVRVDYVGTLINGTEFDNSIKRGESVVLGVDQVIPGWGEALQLMEVGSKYRLVIPSELAYGEKGAPSIIEPNSVLIFDVNLLAIEE